MGGEIQSSTREGSKYFDNTIYHEQNKTHKTKQKHSVKELIIQKCSNQILYTTFLKKELVFACMLLFQGVVGKEKQNVKILSKKSSTKTFSDKRANLMLFKQMKFRFKNLDFDA